MSQVKNICILGGTGFVGRHIVEQLAKQGHRIKIISRHRERHRDLLVLPTVKIVSADIHDPPVLKKQFIGQDTVINLIGILNESGRRTFQKVHVELARKVGEACIMNEVPRLLHMSALKADINGPSKYLRSKGEAEKFLHTVVHDVHVTSFQPSVIFGPEDSFFNRFAKLLRMRPRFAPFPLACAKAKFAPVFVEDVAQAFVRSLDDKRTFAQRYPLCGPTVYTLQELVKYTAAVCGIKKAVLPLGNGPSRLQAMLMGVLPGKPFTVDNFLSATVDSVCEEDFPPVFGINPKAVESVVPLYLGEQSTRKRYSQLRRAARR
ncbi:MAG: complex I NDUFA9 subunit family protein [Gammaproteobacteria bacterium]|nr:complex I NDUFA9 subunit family protein [Gammaproteobacteria bacterium]